jgi:chemotaxis signal transduction protein
MACSAQAFVLVQLGSWQLGVPVSHVVQAVPRPARLNQIPRAQQTLVGTFLYRDQVVPVVDLHQWGKGASDPEVVCQQVLILRVNGQMVGVLVEAVKQLFELTPDQIRRVHQDDRVDEFFHSVGVLQGELVSLLDTERLMTQCQVWAPVNEVGMQQGSAQAGQPQTSAYAVVRLAGVQLAWQTQAVREVLPMPPLQRLGGGSSCLEGVARWRGHDVPVMQVYETLGLPTPQTPSHWLLVLGDANRDRYLGLRIDDIVTVRTFARVAVQSPEGAGFNASALYQGVFVEADPTG